MSAFAGMPVIVSAMVPPPGMRERPNADEIRAENLSILCSGGSLSACEPPRYYFPGILLIDGRRAIMGIEIASRLSLEVTTT